MKTYLLYSLAICVSALLLFGCGGTRPSRLYSLSPAKGVTGDFKTPASATPFAIGIRTLKFPEYLLRQQMVKKSASGEIMLGEYDRWAEPLEVNFQRVLIEDLSRDIPTNNVFLFPAKDSSVTNYQLLLEVTEFELGANNTATLTARWGIAKGEDAVFLMDKKSSFSENLSIDRYEEIAAAMSRLTGKLSEEIAAEIRRRTGSGK